MGAVDNNQPTPADVQTFGLLRTAFVVDPTSLSSSGWWQQSYTQNPDVALNHPSRWSLSSPPLTEPIPDNCRPVAAGSSQVDCATLAASYPVNPWVSLFHHMRGFFISSAQNPEKGPQLGIASAGDKLALQVRVYNYSLARMRADAVVHVRFYVQPWNAETARLKGDSTLVGEDKLGPIPPFSTDDGAPLNWVLANTTLDTTPYANQNLTFWVVVWMEDSSGQLLPEIAGHGLKSIPGILKSLADVDTETYSNNVGFYKYVFHVNGPASIGASQSDALTAINVAKLQQSSNQAVVGQTIEVSALLSTPDGASSSATVVFYDGDPHAGGKAFEVERAPYISPEHKYQAKVLYNVSSA